MVKWYTVIASNYNQLSLLDQVSFLVLLVLGFLLKLIHVKLNLMIEFGIERTLNLTGLRVNVLLL